MGLQHSFAAACGGTVALTDAALWRLAWPRARVCLAQQPNQLSAGRGVPTARGKPGIESWLPCHMLQGMERMYRRRSSRSCPAIAAESTKAVFYMAGAAAGVGLPGSAVPQMASQIRH